MMKLPAKGPIPGEITLGRVDRQRVRDIYRGNPDGAYTCLGQDGPCLGDGPLRGPELVPTASNKM